MNPKTGEVLAMVGGVRFGKEQGSSEFIRATQAVRQPGSSFKPIVYAAALEEGYSPATILTDSPRVFTLSTGRKHSPQNYDGSYLGRISLRESLFRSRNVPTVQLVDQMGARRVIEYARKFGISTAIPEESIIALGTHSLKLSELTRAYSVFPNGGKLVTPVYIMRIEDSNGTVLYENVPESQQVISESTAYMITDILRDVVRHPLGTGYRAMKDLGRPAAGKTGTTQKNTDAWYMGFIPQLVTGVYVGFDDPNIPLGKKETGSKAAAPIWKNFVSRVVKSMPIEGFTQPESVVAMRVDENGKLLSSCDTQYKSRYEFFAVKSVSQRQRMSEGCNTGTLRTVSTKISNTPYANDNPDDEL
jgi:penicillin-binding protein 1A